MAVSYANREFMFRGTWNLLYVEITLDSSYAASGESIAAADFGMTVIKAVNPFSAEGYVVEPVRSSDTAWLIKVFASGANTNTATEIVTGKDLSAVTIPCFIVGR